MVLIGLLLLVKGYDTEGGVVAKDKLSETTTTTVPVRDHHDDARHAPGRGRGEGGQRLWRVGLASQTRTTLQGAGYTQVTISDAPTVVPAPRCCTSRAPRPTPRPWPPPSASTPRAAHADAAPVPLGAATVLVLAGPDLACVRAAVAGAAPRSSALRRRPGGIRVFTDFDGTLSPIVDDPDTARPVDGAVEPSRPWPRGRAGGGDLGPARRVPRAPLRASPVVLSGLYGLQSAVGGVHHDDPARRGVARGGRRRRRRGRGRRPTA